MKYEGKRKLMPILLTLTLLLSMITFMPTGTLAQEVKWYNKYNVEKTAFIDMTPGDKITVKASDLTPDVRYYVYFENESGGAQLLDDERADIDGNIEIDVYVPYRDPLGDYNIYLLDDVWGVGIDVPGSPVTVSISNSFTVKYKVSGSYLDYFILGKAYDRIEISIWKWDGAKLVIYDENVDINLYDPPGTTLEATKDTSTGYWDLDYTFDYMVDNHYENNYWVEVTDGSGPTSNYAYQPCPVKLNMTATLPSNPKWGDTISVEGYLRNGTTTVSGYTVMLIAPSGDTFIVADQTDTYSTGRYSLSAPSNSDGASAGTWYVGTWDDGLYRINESDIVNWPGFIKYFSFDVATSQTAIVKLVSPTKIISGFDQDLNISVYNTSWDENYYYDQMWVHITGVETEWEGVMYDSDEIITLGQGTTMYSSNKKYAYYEYDNIKFNETGKCTIIVTWDNNNSYYEDRNGLLSNITGSTTFDVVSAGNMNIYVDNMVDAVCVNNSDDCCWVNCSNKISITVYGDNEDEFMNASIYITGCGLDITIAEEDAIEDGYWISEGLYEIDVSPRTAGTLTIRCVNDTENISSSRDFSVSGLTGSVKTSVNNDKEISVDTTETIEFTVTYGQFAQVKTCYYDKDWSSRECLNETTGDGTAGNGKDGIFEFTPDVDDIDHVGYIVIVAEAGGNYMYDIIEVAPTHDLTIEIIDPANESFQTFTCGIGHNWELKVYNNADAIVEDLDFVLAEVLDEDGDTIQEYYLKEKSGNIWYMDDFIPHFTGNLLITAWNNSGENEHDGNITFLIECATIEYSPGGTIAGIGLEDISINVTGKDANNQPLPEGTKLYINIEEGMPDGIHCDSELTLDEDGKGEFNILHVGDVQQDINVTINAPWNSYGGNETCGTFNVMWPNFDINPDTIYIGQSNTITVTTTDYNEEPIEGINITFYGSESQILGGTIPDPVMTNTDGISVFSIAPTSSGKLNLTIVKEIVWTDEGVMDWSLSDILVTDQIITITSLKPLTISVSKSPIYQGETLTITILSQAEPVSDVSVTMGEQTAKTDTNGKVTFTIPDPGVDAAIYTITATKFGYITEEKSITILKQWEITIVGPASVEAGASFTVTVIAKGQPLAGATCTYDGTTVTTDGEGKASIKAPSTTGTYTVTATFGNYKPGTFTITIKSVESPGFELITLIIAIGVAFLLLKSRRRK